MDDDFFAACSFPECVLYEIVISYISNLSSKHRAMIKDALRIYDLSSFKDVRNFFQKSVSFGQKLKVFFKVPNHQIMSNFTLNPNQVVAAFINFLLQMVEAAIIFEADSTPSGVKASIRNLQTELGFLITFLGDTAMHLQPTNSKNILIDIEAVVNEVGTFFYSFFFTMTLHILLRKEENTSDSEAEEADSETEEAEFSKPIDIESVFNDSETKEDEFFKPIDIEAVFSDSETKEVDSETEEADFETEEADSETEKADSKTEEMGSIDIEAVFSEVGSFIDSFIITRNDQVPKSGILDLALSGLLSKFELLKTSIKEHCTTVSKMPGDVPPKTAVVSLFIVDSVVDDLMDLINNNTDTIVGLDDLIVTLHDELMLLRSSVMKIAEQQEAEHEELLIRTIDIAYEVEYVIKSFPPVWYLTFRLPQLTEKIRLIRMAVEEMEDKIGAAGMPEVAKYPGEQISQQSKGPPILEDIVVGFDNVEIKIAEQLVGETKQLQIISIIGMPGLGKSTLANKLYNHPSIVHRFDDRAWCVSSQTYNKRNMLIEILMSINHFKRETITDMEEEKLAEKLYKSLKGRRYILVIDDIWDINAWNDLERYFPDDETGSRILFTSRNKEVGLKASPNSVIYALPFLSDAECWKLLQWKVFQEENCPRELVDIGKEIAKKCQGLPLAVVVIAGVLANMEKEEQVWQKLGRNFSSHISGSPDKCMQILELSYQHLPMHLKPCFLYFGLFEEDMEIHIQTLIWLWVAEGFIKKEENKSLDDVALEYLIKLIDRSLVLVSRRGSNGEVKACKVHDQLHELCRTIAQENNFLKTVNLSDDDDDDIPWSSKQVLMYQQNHRLSIYDNSFSRKPFGLHVRSLFCADFRPLTLTSRSLKVIRVLAISDHSSSYAVTQIGNMVYLRFLMSSGTLPPMESFHKLEVLYLDNPKEVKIPDVLLNMASLRHMHFSGGACFSKYCRRQAIKDKSFQINSNLESIAVLSIWDETDEKILRCLPKLRRLKGKDSPWSNHSFDCLNQLESLNLQSYTKRPSSSLISLPLNLKKLTLSKVYVSLKQIEIIRRLQYLEVLKLKEVAFEGEQWDTSEVEFPQLKFLRLECVQLTEWNASSENFPRLQRLELRNCEHLKMIPSSLGDIPTLLMIEVYMCAKDVEESAKQIREEQEEMGNEELQVIITNRHAERGESGEESESGKSEEECGSVESEEESY